MAYTVKEGDQLLKLYGPNWKQLSGYTGDPTKLQIGTQLLDLPGIKSTDTSIASNIKPTAGLLVPPTSSPSTQTNNSSNGLVSFYQSQFETAQKQQADIQAQRDAAQAQQNQQTQGFLSKIIGAKSPEQVRSEATAQSSIQPTEYFAEQKASIAELDTLNQDYNKVVADRDKQIAMATGQPGQSLDFSNNQIAQINRNAAPVLNQMASNINSKAATFQAKQGLFQEAQQFVDKAVNAATADLKFNVDMFQTFYQINQDRIDKLDTQYQSALKDAQTYALNAYTTAYNEKNAVGELMMNNPQAGINVGTDNLEQAMAKVGANPMAQKGEIFGSAEEGYKERYYDPISNSYKTRSLGGGTGGAGTGVTGLSKALKADFDEDMASISTFKSKEEALSTFQKLSPAMISKYGQKNYDLLLKAVDTVFPVAPITPKTETPIISQGGFQTGQAAKGLIGKGIENFKAGVEIPGFSAVGDFFKGLFR